MKGRDVESLGVHWGLGDGQTGRAEDEFEAGHVGRCKGGKIMTVEVEDAPADAGRFEAGDDDLGLIAGIAGDVVWPEVADITHDEWLTGAKNLAAGAVQADRGACGFVAPWAANQLGSRLVKIKTEPRDAGWSEGAPERIHCGLHGCASIGTGAKSSGDFGVISGHEVG